MTKAYPGVVANSDISFAIAHEIYALPAKMVPANDPGQGDLWFGQT